MKNRTDLNLGNVFCLSIIHHIPDSWLNLLNGYDFYFRCKPPIKLVSLRKLAPSRNIVFNQTGMDFVTEISFCMKTPVVHKKGLVFRGWKSAREII